MTSRPLRLADLFSHPANFFALGFGAGLSRYAPGTVGTVVAIPIYWLLADLAFHWYLAALIFMAAVGIYLCHATARDLGVHDHGGIVWDEIVGYLITMVAAPDGWLWVLLGFVLFRIYDIYKPWLIAWADRHVNGGVGIMLDDVLAGLFALATLQIIALLL